VKKEPNLDSSKGLNDKEIGGILINMHRHSSFYSGGLYNSFICVLLLSGILVSVALDDVNEGVLYDTILNCWSLPQNRIKCAIPIALVGSARAAENRSKVSIFVQCTLTTLPANAANADPESTSL